MLTSRTLYYQYIYVTESGLVSDDKLVPHDFTSLHGTFVLIINTHTLFLDTLKSILIFTKISLICYQSQDHSSVM